MIPLLTRVKGSHDPIKEKPLTTVRPHSTPKYKYSLLDISEWIEILRNHPKLAATITKLLIETSSGTVEARQLSSIFQQLSPNFRGFVIKAGAGGKWMEKPEPPGAMVMGSKLRSLEWVEMSHIESRLLPYYLSILTAAPSLHSIRLHSYTRPWNGYYQNLKPTPQLTFPTTISNITIKHEFVGIPQVYVQLLNTNRSIEKITLHRTIAMIKSDAKDKNFGQGEDLWCSIKDQMYLRCFVWTLGNMREFYYQVEKRGGFTGLRELVLGSQRGKRGNIDIENVFIPKLSKLETIFVRLPRKCKHTKPTQDHHYMAFYTQQPEDWYSDSEVEWSPPTPHIPHHTLNQLVSAPKLLAIRYVSPHHTHDHLPHSVSAWDQSNCQGHLVRTYSGCSRRLTIVQSRVGSEWCFLADYEGFVIDDPLLREVLEMAGEDLGRDAPARDLVLPLAAWVKMDEWKKEKLGKKPSVCVIL